MIDIQYIRSFFPATIAQNPAFDKQMIKEYLQLLILNHLSESEYASRVAFIGGTNLRLIRHIDRFSEDLDFDCHELSEADFMVMTDDIVSFLQKYGLNVETRDRKNERLTAYRRNLYFPQLLFDLQLSGHRDERFLIKIEAQNQGIEYQPQTSMVMGCGLIFPIQTPPTGVLCAMKISALLSRRKGRDFYDTMFLLGQGIEPDFDFLNARCGIADKESLRQAMLKVAAETDLELKMHDFEHMLFNPENNKRVLYFTDFVTKWGGERRG